MKYKVLISAPYMLKEKHKVLELLNGLPLDIVWADVEERLEEDDLLESLNGVEGIICGDDRITSRVIDSANNLKVIVKWGTGIDSINKDYAATKGIPVFRTPGAFTEPVSETTIGLILSFCRNIHLNDQIIKSGDWNKPQGFTLSEKRIGIIGFGDIGRSVTKKLAVFGVEVLVNDIVDIDFTGMSARKVDKKEIYATCDFITLHCDLNDSSHKVLNMESFEAMKMKPFIINTARGPLIDENSLIWALKEGMISGAGLDVFEYEPLPLDSPLRNMNNVLLAAHNSNSSPKYWANVHSNSIKMLMEGLLKSKI